MCCTIFFPYSKPKKEAADWPPYEHNTKKYLFLDTDLTEVRQNLRPAKMTMWNHLIPKMLASFSQIQDGIPSNAADCWTVTTVIIVAVVGVSVIVFLVIIVRYIRLKQKLQRVKYLHSLPAKT